MPRYYDDPSIEWFLALDGTIHFADEKCKYRIKIEAKRTDVTAERPHGLSYSLNCMMQPMSEFSALTTLIR